MSEAYLSRVFVAYLLPHVLQAQPWRIRGQRLYWEELETLDLVRWHQSARPDDTLSQAVVPSLLEDQPPDTTPLQTE